MERMEVSDICRESQGTEDRMPIDMPGKEIECPDCQQFYPADQWFAVDSDCDCCGGHMVLFCPVKESTGFHIFDPYYGDHTQLNVRDV